VLKQLKEEHKYVAYSGMEVRSLSNAGFSNARFSVRILPVQRHVPSPVFNITNLPSETPKSAADKGFRNLVPLTPGNHGYSLLRTQLNKDYFHDLYDDVGLSTWQTRR
jgi:hypothetical protein